MERGPVLGFDEDGLTFRAMPSGNLYPVRTLCQKCQRFTQVRAILEPPDGAVPYDLLPSQRRLYLRPYCSVCSTRLPFETLDDLDMSQRPQPRKKS